MFITHEGRPSVLHFGGLSGVQVKKEATYSLKITKAEFTNVAGSGGKSMTKNTLTPISHMYLEITEVSTNVTLLKAAIQRKWGEKESDNSEKKRGAIEDSSAERRTLKKYVR